MEGCTLASEENGQADLLFTNGTVITVDPARRVLENTSIAIVNGRIKEIGPAAVLNKKYGHAKVLDCSQKAILPGLIDLHGYIGWSVMKSLGDTLDAVGSRNLYEIILSQLTDEDWWLVEAQMCALDRIKFGTTFMFSMMGGNGTRTDDPIFTRTAARGLSQVGIRSRIGIGPARPPWPRVYSRWIDGKKVDREVPFDEVIDNCDALLGGERDPSGLSEYCTALSRFGNRNAHDPVWSPDREQWVYRQAEAIRHLMDKHDVPFWTHAYGNAIEFAYDEKLGLLGPKTILSHCTDLPARAISIMQETGTSVGHQPRIGRVISHDCPVPEMIEAGIAVGLGTDAPSTNAADLFLDMRAAMLLQRIRFRNPRMMPPGKALEMATIDGARALGLDKEIGSIEVGKRADLITIDMRQPHLYPLDMVALRVVTNASGKDVNDVVVGGNIVMQDRKMMTVDEDAILDQAQAMYHRTIERGSLQALTAIRDGFWNVVR
jgi:cytosine/adenosine deaminase-related metal-dependent hydrolase